MKTSKDLIHSVLHQLSHSKQAQYYLKHYSANDGNKLIVIKVGGDVIKNDLKQLTESLSLLYFLGITPVILHGAGSQIDQELKNHNRQSQKIDGIRVTSIEDMALVEKGVLHAHQSLKDSLSSAGIQTSSFFNSVFTCDYLDQDTYGQVGKISSVINEEVKSSLKNHCLPIITCLGKTSEGEPVNINADIALRRLVWSLRPMKVIFLTPTGGLLNGQNQIISAIQLNENYDNLMSQKWLHSGMKLKIQQIFKLLKPLPRSLSVSITSVSNLSKELFTHKGQGTYLTMGERIHHYEKIPSAAKLKIISLLESTFKKKLKPDFLDRLNTLSIFLSESSQAVAIISKGHNDKPYLNKFAVTERAQGQGLGKMIWEKVIDYYPEIYWRSRVDNSINDWYYKQSTSSLRNENWVSFSHGMSLHDSMECMNQASQYSDSWQETSA